MNQLFFGKIGTKLTVLTVGLCALLILGASALQVYVEFQRDVGSTEARLGSVPVELRNAISKDIWNLDMVQLKFTIDTMREVYQAEFVGIKSDELESPQSGTINSKAAISFSYPLIYQAQGQQQLMGTLTVQTGYSEIYSRAIDRAWAVLTTNSIIIVLVASTLLALVRCLVTRPLVEITESISNLGFSGLISPKVLSRSTRKIGPDDEVDSLISGYNATQSRLSNTLGQLQTSNVLLDLELKNTQDLAENLNEQNIKLDASRLQAENASKVKTNFLSNISHELRTPLTSIIGFSRMLHSDQLTPEKRQHYLNIVSRNSIHLLTLVEDLLDISKIEAGELRIDIAPTDIKVLLDDVMTSSQGAAATKGLALSFSPIGDLPEYCETDAVRLKQIVFNLISNAVKFTEIGYVLVEAECCQKTSMLTITVSDSGPGVPPNKRELIFKPFVQADETITRNHGGSGLGLAISRNLARVLGGDVVFSAPKSGEAGSQFIATIMLANCGFTHPTLTSLDIPLLEYTRIRKDTPFDPESQV